MSGLKLTTLRVLVCGSINQLVQEGQCTTSVCSIGGVLEIGDTHIM